MTEIPPGGDEHAPISRGCSLLLAGVGLILIISGLIWGQINRDFEVLSGEPYWQAAAMFTVGGVMVVLAWLFRRKS